ncbi:MAG: peptidoglycan-binding protein LysM [Bacteroidia bacterium]|nr:peptidoglycan-binding protein LysM [Bacteroidia bacterium]
MGVFSFLKNAGAKLFGGKEEAPINEVEPVKVQDALKDLVSRMDLGIDAFDVSFSNGTATVFGVAHSQSDKEKAILTVGNVEGVESVNDQITLVETAPAATEADFYTVESGDTLGKIAKHFYGDSSRYMVIFEENKPMLGHPDKIYPGQVLRIPKM